MGISDSEMLFLGEPMEHDPEVMWLCCPQCDRQNAVDVSGDTLQCPSCEWRFGTKSLLAMRFHPLTVMTREKQERMAAQNQSASLRRMADQIDAERRPANINVIRTRLQYGS